jgi:hypothetical protein
MPKKKQEEIKEEIKEAEVVAPQVKAPSEQDKMSYGQNP